MTYASLGSERTPMNAALAFEVIERTFMTQVLGCLDVPPRRSAMSYEERAVKYTCEGALEFPYLNRVVSPSFCCASERDFVVREAWSRTNRVDISPLGQQFLLTELAASGHVLSEVCAVMFATIDAAQPDEGVSSPDITITTAAPDSSTCSFFRQTLGEPWGAASPLPESFEALPTQLARTDDFVFLTCRVAGMLAGWTMLFVSGPTGLLAGTFVSDAFRKRGIHKALTHARLSALRQRGCRLAVASATAGGQSHRNLEQNGFNVAYMKLTFAPRKHRDRRQPAAISRPEVAY